MNRSNRFNDDTTLAENIHAHILGFQPAFRAEAKLQRVEGALTAILDSLTARVKALEDEIHSLLAKRG